MTEQIIKEVPDVEMLRQKPKRKKRLFKWLLLGVILIGLGVGIFFGRKGIAEGVKNIPVLNKIFKVQETSENVEESPEVKTLKATIESLNQQITSLTQANEALTTQVDTLKSYEEQYNDFLVLKSKWEQEVAHASGTEFVKYYEKIAPESAQTLYRELKSQQVATKDQKAYAKVVADMDEEAAAKALVQIVGTDPELVKYVFAGMTSERQSAILSVMDEKVTPQVIKLIAPSVDK
ncbi:MAG: hypothetical protein ACRCW2_16790 [Cellulosilyticaceae bacterium]